jgi:hypothetical protein
MKTSFLKIWIIVVISMFSLIGCGENTTESIKSPKNTVKLLRALANDETDWTWFVGTEASFSKVEDKETLTIVSSYYQGIPKKVQHLQYFIDSDNNAKTGFSYGRDSWRISGADYLVEDGALYKSNSTSKWDWTYVGEFSSFTRVKLDNDIVKVTFSSSDKVITSMIDKAHIPTYINVTIEPFDVNWGSTYSTISTDQVKLEVDGVIPDDLNDTMVLSSEREDATILLHDDTPKGAYFSYENDDFVGDGKKVVQLHSAGLDNSFHFVGYETELKYDWWSLPSHQFRHHISWDGNFGDDFIVFIVLKFKTADGRVIRNDLVYGPSRHGYIGYTDGFLYTSLGESARDGNWHHFERNILDDLHQFYPGATIDYSDNYSGLVNGFAVRGAGRITNIKLSAH